MTYLGLKDNLLLDHMDPNFPKALEKKTAEKLKELKAMAKSYNDD
jgi:hypothetical protein